MVMAHRRPSSHCSESAAAALGHLQDVEKQFESKGPPFNEETVRHLEDAVKAIKKLEEERKHTIDLLEEETIKNCNFRIRIKGYPAMVMKEFEELVAAARRFRFFKLSEIETSTNEATNALQQVCTRQKLSEEQNETLCVEQGQVWTRYTDIVQQVNKQMDEKHSINILINELHNLKNKEEEDIVSEEIAIEELRKLMASEALTFKENKTSLELQIAELRRQLEIKKCNLEEKKKEYEDFQKVLCDLKEEIAKHNQNITALREELKAIFKTIKKLIKTYEMKKAEKQSLLQQRQVLQYRLSIIDADFDDEKEHLLQQLKETEKQLETCQQIYQKIEEEHNLLEAQYKKLLNEEEHYASERDKLAAELEKLSNMLTERLDYVAKRVMETRNVQDELDDMMDLYEEEHGGCSKEMGSLEALLKKESDKSAKLQTHFNKISEQYKGLTEAHEMLLSNSEEEITAAKDLITDLREKNEYMHREIKEDSEKWKFLSSSLLKKGKQYKKLVADLTEETKNLEEEYNTKTKMVEEMELKLQEDTPLLESLQQELEEKRTNYTKQKEIYQALREEEITLKKNIELSVKEVKRLERLKVIAKTDLKTNRNAALQKLEAFMYSLKFIERDNYEVGRMLFILNAENERLKAGIAYLREGISTLDSEANVYQSKRQKAQNDRKALYELFAKEWKKDDLLEQMFNEYQREVWIILGEYVRRYRKRNDKIDYIHEGLQLNCEEMETLLKSKSIPDADKFVTEPLPGVLVLLSKTNGNPMKSMHSEKGRDALLPLPNMKGQNPH